MHVCTCNMHVCNVTCIFYVHVHVTCMFVHAGFTLNTLLHSDATGDATVLQTHRYTPPEQLAINTRQADIIIVACGM